MRKVYGLLVTLMLACVACQWQLKPNDTDNNETRVSIQRYDRIESLYLTTGDRSAMQQMNTYFPMQTRTLIEDVLRLGQVNDPEINAKFLHFFQDSTLQAMLQTVQQQYSNIEDLNDELTNAFDRLKEDLPSLIVPDIYTQIGSFDQSIIVSGRSLGICLDKYLGADYPFYQTHYSDQQRRMMVRQMIVPDCLSFYILSLFPIPQKAKTQQERDSHIGCIQWLVNRATGRDVFQNEFVRAAGQLIEQDSRMTIEQLLRR